MKSKHSFTIHTELLDGSLEGARNIYMGANSTCHLYVIPRAEIALANNIHDIVGQPAFYILFNSSDEMMPQAYIGQTTDFSNRKNDHLQKKDFWDTAFVFISDNHKVYGDDVKYLEYLGIEAAQSAASSSATFNCCANSMAVIFLRLNCHRLNLNIYSMWNLLIVPQKELDIMTCRRINSC